MAYKKVETRPSVDRNELTWKFDNNLYRVFEGKYRGSATVKKADGTESQLHNFYTLDGKTVGIWGKSVLDANIPQILKEGAQVRITYLGKVKSSNGTYYYDNFEFEIDEPEADKPF